MKLRKILSAVCAGIVATAMCGCSIKVGTNKTPKDDEIMARPTGSAYSERTDLEISYADFRKEYVYYLKSYGITDDSEENVAEMCKAQRDTIINYLVTERIEMDKAKEYGVETLTSEEMDAIETQYNALVEEQIVYWGEQADYGELETGEVITDEQKKERGNEEFDKYLADCGLTRDDLLMWQVNAAVREKLVLEVTKDITADRSEAEKQLDDYITSVKAVYAEDVYEYETGTYSAFWVPEGSRRIKHILLGFDDTFVDELKACRENGDNEGADRLRTQKAEEMQQQIDEVNNMLDNGADFDELLLTYSADSAGSSMNPDGYLVVPNGESFMAEFQQAAFEMENVGDRITAVTDYGVHIMIYASDAEISAETREEYINVIYDQMMENERNIRYNQLLTEWKNEYAFEIEYEALKIDAPTETSETSAE